MKICNNGHNFTDENTYVRASDGYKECRECRRQQQYKWKNLNRDKISKNNKEYYSNNREYMIEKIKLWQNNNPDLKRSYAHTYRRRHPDKLREDRLRYKYRKINQTGVFSSWMERYYMFFQQGNCYYCGTDLDSYKHLEHKIPISKGGLHCWTNTVLSCPTCNFKKGSKTELEFLKQVRRKGKEILPNGFQGRCSIS